MLTAQLEDRYREALGDRAGPERNDSITFAVEFVRLLARIAPHEVSQEARNAMRNAASIEEAPSPQK